MSAGNLGTATLELTTNSRGLERGLSDAQRKTQRTSQTMSQSMANVGRSMTNVGKTATVGLTLPIVGIGAAALKMGGDFQQSMNQVKAVSGATGDEFTALQDQAKELGRTTQFSASQSADAMGFLAMAGFEANEVLGAMPGTLQLAAAANMDLADAADTVSNILTGYGMEVEELSHVNDVLVKTMTSANVDLNMLGESMKYVGPIASSAGVQFEEAAASIGLMGNAGIQGSQAGTSLRMAISQLINPTDSASTAMQNLGVNATDSTGQLLPLEDIVRQLEESGADTADMMTIFGQRAGPAMAALVSQGADSLSDLTTELENSGGTAEEIAAVQMEGLNGAIKRLKSAFEGLMIAIAESGLMDFVAGLVERLAGLITRITELNPKIMTAIVIFGGLVAAIGPLLIVGGMLMTSLAALAPVFAALSAPILAVVGAVVALGVAFATDFMGIRTIVGNVLGYIGEQLHQFRYHFMVAFGDHDEGPVTLVQHVAAAFGDFAQFLRDKVQPIWIAVRDSFITFKDALSGNWVDDDAIRPLHRFVGNIGLAIDGLIDRVRSGFDIIRDSFLTFFQALSGDWEDDEDILPIHRAIGNLGNMGRDLFDTIGGPLGDAWGSITDGVDTVIDTLGDLLDDVSGLVDVFNALRTGELGPLEDALADLPGWLEPVGEAMVTIYDAVSDVITAFREDGFIAGLKEILEVAPDVAEAIWDLASAYANDLWDAVTDVEWLEIGQDILDSLTDAITTAAGFVADVATTIYDWIAEPVSEVDWSEVGSTIWDGIKTAFGAVVAGVVIAGETIFDWVSRAVDWVQWGDIASAIWDGITAAFEAIVSVASDAGSTVLGWISSGVDAITDVEWGNIASTIWSGITTGVTTAALTVAGLAVALYDWVAGGVEEVEWSELATSIWDSITDAVTTAAVTVADWATSLYDWISGGVSEVDWSGIGDDLGSNISSAWDTATGAVSDAWGWLSGTVSDVDWDGIGTTLSENLSSAWESTTNALDSFDTWLRNALDSVDWDQLGTDLNDGLQSAWEFVQSATEQFDAWLRDTIGADETGPAFSGDLKDNLSTWLADAWDGVEAATDKFDAWLRDSIGAPSSGPIFTEEMFNNLISWIEDTEWDKLGERFGEFIVDMVSASLSNIGKAVGAFTTFVGDLISGGTSDNKEEHGENFAAGLGEALVYGLVGTVKLTTTVLDAFDEFLKGMLGPIGDALVEWGSDLLGGWYDGFQSAIDDLESENQKLKDAVAGWFEDLYNDVLQWVEDLVNGVIGFFQDLYDDLVGNSIVPDLVNEIITAFEQMWDDIISYLQDNLEAMKDALSAPFVWLAETFDWDSITDIASSTWDTIQDYFDDGKQAMQDALSAPFDWFRDNVGNIMAQAGSFALKPLKWVIDGLNTLGGSVVGALSDIGDMLAVEALSELSWSNVGEGFSTSIPDPREGGMGGGVHSSPPAMMRMMDMGADGPLEEHAEGMGGWNEIKGALGSGIDFVSGLPGDAMDFIRGGVEAAMGTILDQFPIGLDFPGVLSHAGDAIVGLVKDGLRSVLSDLFTKAEEGQAELQASLVPGESTYTGPISGNWINPVPGSRFTQGSFGSFSHSSIPAVDLAAARGTSIFAPAAGQVSSLTMAGGTGRTGMIDHGNGFASLYGHVSSFAPVGTSLAQADWAGAVGSPEADGGFGSGAHLHFEMFRNGGRVPPESYIAFANGGIVTEPTMGLVGEAGPEAIIPLGGDAMASWMPVGEPVPVTIDNWGSIGDIGGKYGPGDSGLGGIVAGIADKYTQQAIGQILDEEGTQAWTSGIGDLLTGRLIEELEQSLAETEKFIQFGIAKGWPPAVIDALNDEKAGLQSDIEATMADMATAFEAGLLDPSVARDLGFATVEMVDGSVIDKVVDMTGDMAEGGAGLLGAVIDGMESGRLDLEQAAKILPDSVVPELERMEQKLTVDLAEALIAGTDPSGIEQNIEMIAGLLDELGGTADDTAKAVSNVTKYGSREEAKQAAGAGQRSFSAFADGGIINEPIAGLGLRTGTRYLMGEEGPEEITPLNDRNGKRRVVRTGDVSINVDGEPIARAVGKQWFEGTGASINLVGGA